MGAVARDEPRGGVFTSRPAIQDEPPRDRRAGGVFGACDKMQGKMIPIQVPTRVVPASREALQLFPVDKLREYARDLGVPRGRSKKDTIENLVKSGKATVCASLGN